MASAYPTAARITSPFRFEFNGPEVAQALAVIQLDLFGRLAPPPRRP